MNAATPSPSGSITVALKYPVKAKGLEVNKITLRRPKVKDTRILEGSGDGDLDASNKFMAQLSGLPPEVFDELDLADMKALQKVVEAFTKDVEKQ